MSHSPGSTVFPCASITSASFGAASFAPDSLDLVPLDEDRCVVGHLFRRGIEEARVDDREARGVMGHLLHDALAPRLAERALRSASNGGVTSPQTFADAFAPESC